MFNEFLQLNMLPMTTRGSVCRTPASGTRLRCLLLLSPTVSPFTVPWYTATEILLIGSFSHKSCHPPNKAIKMFVCIIEGKVLPWVSFKQWCVRACRHS